MRILFLTNNLPYPPASGGAIRAHGIIEGMFRAGHAVTLLCFHEGEIEDVPEAMQIETFPPPIWSKSQRLKILFSGQSDIAGRFMDAAFAKRLAQLLQDEQFDIVQFEGIEMVCYLPQVRAQQPAAKLIFDTFNAEYALMRTIFYIDRKNPRRWPLAAYSFTQIGRIKRYEAKMCQMADAVVCVSPEDKTLLEPLCPGRRIDIVASGIWVDHYTPTLDVLYSQSLPKTDSPSLVFTGKMDYRPNVDAMLWFTEEIWPLVQEQVPGVQLFIVGQKPHARIAHLDAQPNIYLTGWVDSVIPFLQMTDVYIAPLRMGSGTRLKLLEAMACGCAIVATEIASAGLNNATRSAMKIVDGEQDQAAAIVELLNDSAQRKRLGELAQDQVRQHYDWSVLIPQFLDVYRAIGIEI